MEEHPDVIEEGILRASGKMTPANAGDVIAAVTDLFAEKKIPIASRHKGIIGKQAKELLDDGFDFGTVTVAAVMALRRSEPQNLHFIASDLVMARAGERMTRREYERALQDEIEIGGSR